MRTYCNTSYLSVYLDAMYTYVRGDPQNGIYLFKNWTQSTEPWLVWLSGLSAGLQTKRLPAQFPIGAQAWVAGRVPSWAGTRSS